MPYIKAISGIAILFVLTFHTSVAQQNIVLLIADDVSPDYFSFYASSDTANTPVLTALTKNGVVFNRAWAYPVCSPTRASIFTGRYGFRTGMGTVVAGPGTNQLSTGETSIAALLKTQTSPAYSTACVGKWHLHSQQPANFNKPSLMGYDFYSGNFAGAINSFFNYPIVTNGLADTVTQYATTQTINDAIGWLDTLPAGNPFFLWVAFNAPHEPYHKPPDSLITNTSLPGTVQHINANKSEYFKAAIEALDTETGRLIQYLDTHNLLDSTNFIFIGDNGSPEPVTQNPVPNQSKGTIYNYGVHVPFFVSGPSVVSPDRTTDALVCTVDLFATMGEMAGISNFNPNNVTLDSKSFLSIIKNQNANQRTWAFSEQFGTSAAADGKSIRNTDYHLIRFDSSAEEFYNVSIDPFETNNLLLSPGLGATDIANYHFLCDSLNVLVGAGNCLPLSTGHSDDPAMLGLFPNPSHTCITVRMNSEGFYDFTIRDLHGRTLKKGKTMEGSRIDISDLRSGIYLIQFANDSKAIRRFIKY